MSWISKNKPTRTLIISMMVVVGVAILVARAYYGNINQSADPRTVEARLAYQHYNQLARSGEYLAVKETLDSVENYYAAYPHYQDSYEIGVACVNRAALYLTVGLHIDSLRVNHELGFLSDLTKKGLFDLAEEELHHALRIYSDWDSVYGQLNEAQLKEQLKENFFIGLEAYSDEEKSRFFDQRLKDLEDAQWETDRRLSVAYTNLAMVYFHRDNFEEAARLFKKAVDLWEDNLNAKNNLNRMLGRPLEKRNFIQKLFPKSRDQKTKK